MAKQKKIEEQEPRSYTMEFEDGKKVVKKPEELTGDQVYACEKLRVLNAEIGRLNMQTGSPNDLNVLREHYQRIAEPAFKENEDDSEDSAEA